MKMTEKSLNEAFAGESMAHMKYLAFSKVAKEEGFDNVSRLFKAIAYAEQVHAVNHAKNLGLIKKSAENLQTGVDGENFEVDEMYPAYKAIAKLQKHKGAQLSIHYALEAEKSHAKLYSEAKKNVDDGKDVDFGDIYICDECGYTHVGGELPEKCPVCKKPQEIFIKF